MHQTLHDTSSSLSLWCSMRKHLFRHGIFIEQLRWHSIPNPLMTIYIFHWKYLGHLISIRFLHSNPFVSFPKTSHDYSNISLEILSHPSYPSNDYLYISLEILKVNSSRTFSLCIPENHSWLSNYFTGNIEVIPYIFSTAIYSFPRKPLESSFVV